MGNYSCQCKPGYTGDGYNCTGLFISELDGIVMSHFFYCSGTTTDVNECAESSDGCSENATCHDTDGGYWCECLPGFQGDGYNCTGQTDRMDNKTQC